MESAGEKSTTNPCRAIVTRRDPMLQQPSKSHLAYFINISINNKNLHDPLLANLRIKIPKLLARTVKKSHPSNNVGGDEDGSGSAGSNGSNNKSSAKRWSNSKKIFPKKVKSMLSDVIGSAKKSGITYLSDVFAGGKKSRTTSFDSGNVSSDGKEIIDRRNRESSAFRFDHNELDYLSSTSSRDTLNSEEYFTTASQGNAKQGGQQICMVCRHHLSEIDEKETYLGFYNKRIPSKNLMHLRGKRSDSSKYSSSINSNSDSDWSFMRKERVSWGDYLKESGTTDEGEGEGEGEEEEDGSEEADDGGELWKKRILMGGRCRPLNFSGCIHYDENGNPVPEFPIKPSSSFR